MSADDWTHEQVTAGELNTRLAFANSMADEVAEFLMERFKFRPVAAEAKADGSPVTEHDRACEALIRQRLSEAYPDERVLGEELTTGEELAAWNGDGWVIDPIDGTRSYAAGVPLFGSLIAWCQGGEALVGVVSMPAIGERVSAAKGLGSSFLSPAGRVDGIRVAEPKPGEEPIVQSTSRDYFRDCGVIDAWDRVEKGPFTIRGWSDCYAMALVASGRAHAVVEPRCMAWWDLAAPSVVLAEAGAVVTDWSGAPLREQDRLSLLAASPGVHADLLGLLAR